MKNAAIKLFVFGLWILSFTTIIYVGFSKPVAADPKANPVDFYDTILLNLSYSFITAIFVYILTVYMPSTERRKSYEKILELKFNHIRNHLKNCILCAVNEEDENNDLIKKFITSLKEKGYSQDSSLKFDGKNCNVIEYWDNAIDACNKIVSDSLPLSNYLSTEQISFIYYIRRYEDIGFYNQYKDSINDFSSNGIYNPIAAEIMISIYDMSRCAFPIKNT